MLLSDIRIGGELPRTCIHFSRGGTSKRWDMIFTKIGLRRMLENLDRRLLDKAFRLLAGLIFQDTEYAKTAFMSRVHTRYSESATDPTK